MADETAHLDNCDFSEKVSRVVCFYGKRGGSPVIKYSLDTFDSG